MPAVGVGDIIEVFVDTHRPGGAKISVHISHATFEEGRTYFRDTPKGQYADQQRYEAEAFNFSQWIKGAGTDSSIVHRLILNN